MDEDFENKMYDEIAQFTEREMANHVGFIISLRTYAGDCMSGMINCVKKGGVYITDIQNNKCFCSLEMISFFVVHPKVKKRTKKQKS